MKQMSEIRYKHWIRLFGCLVLLWIVGCTQADVDDDIPLPTLKEVDAGFNLNVLAKPYTGNPQHTVYCRWHYGIGFDRYSCSYSAGRGTGK